MNFEQVKGILERVLTVGATWAVAKGLLPEAISADVVALGVLAASVVWGFVVNRPAALAEAAAKTS